jgi:hypothetical protein
MFLGLVLLGVYGGVVVLGGLLAALLRGRNRPLIVILVLVFGPGLCLLPAACTLSGSSSVTESDATTGELPTVVATEAMATATSVEIPAATETPSDTGLSAREIIAESVEAMNGVTSAHIVFEQEVVGGYTASGEGVLLLPDRAHFDKVSSYDQAPVETIVIGSTGYWADDSVSGGWNSGPIAPFGSNPARWVELLRFYQKTLLLGEEMVHKVQCYHLWFKVNFEPGWLGLFSGEGTGEAWIAREDFSLVKAIYDVQYEGSRESDTMKLAFELSDLNAPVTVEAPR